MAEPYIRNLPVPYFSQRENSYTWKEREAATSGVDKNTQLPIPNPDAGNIKQNGIKKLLATTSCNITCILMVLHYLGITSNPVDYFLMRIFNPDDELYDRLRKALIDDKFQKKIYEKENGKLVYTRSELFTEKEYLPDYTIEANQFGPAFVNTFFDNQGLTCYKFFKNIDTILEENIAKGLPVILFAGTTSIPLAFSAFSMPKKGVNNDPLKAYLDENTKSNDYRIDMGSGFTYARLLDYKTDYENNENIIKSDKSSEEEIADAQSNIENIRTEINNYKVSESETHFIVVRGYTDNEVIINDPWGEVAKDNNGHVILTNNGTQYDGMWQYYDEEKSAPFGENIRIKKNDFKKRYKDDGTCFVWTFEKKSLWDFVYPNVLPMNRKPVLADYLDCYDKEENFFGGYPVRKALTWHTGIHIEGEKSVVKAMGPGQVIGARIRDGAPGEDLLLNGSRCFVLLKHQILLDNQIKEFYSLYYHLWPIYNLEEMYSDYPLSDNEYCPPWLEDLIAHCYDRAICKGGKKIYNLESDAQVGVTDLNTLIIVKGTMLQNIDDKEQRVLIFEKDEIDVYSSIWSFRTRFVNDDINIYKEKIDQLVNGDIVYFDDLPDRDGMIEVGSREELACISHKHFKNVPDLNKIPLIYSD